VTLFGFTQVEMTSVDWQLSLKVVNQPKSTFHFPEMMPGDVPPGEYRVATLKQLVAAQLPDTVNDPEMIGPLKQSANSMHTMSIFLNCSSCLFVVVVRCFIHSHHRHLFYKWLIITISYIC